MSISKWKYSYNSLNEKNIVSNKENPFKVFSRSSVITENFLNQRVAVYNGKVFIPVTVTEAMLGYKFGDFAPTRTFRGHAGDKKSC